MCYFGCKLNNWENEEMSLVVGYKPYSSIQAVGDGIYSSSHAILKKYKLELLDLQYGIFS